MRLSNFTDYGLRMLMLMAAEPERGSSSAELADALALSRNHLAKIIQHLSQAGLVETKRGGNGGLRLAKRPQDVRLGALVALLEQDRALVACFADPTDSGCTLTGQCRLKARLRAAEAAFLAELDRSTLADIALVPQSSSPQPSAPQPSSPQPSSPQPSSPQPKSQSLRLAQSVSGTESARP